MGPLLSGEKVIMFLSDLRDVKDTSSSHSGIGSYKLYRQGMGNSDEKWCCVMTLYRVIVFSFLEHEFDGSDASNVESASNGNGNLVNQQVAEWVASASVSRQFQVVNYAIPQKKFHQVMQMPLASIERVEKSTDFSPTSTTQMTFGSSTMYSDNLGGSVANGTLILYGKDNGRFIQFIQFTTKSHADCVGAYKQLCTYAFPGTKKI